MPGWIFIGQGSFNKAYVSFDKKEVLKVRFKSADTDSPERSVRLWNLINSHIHPPARLATTEHGSGWICPYIEGVQASDKEMADAVIDIFNRTGRIVIDATATKNFIKTPAGQVVCVDIGLALQLEDSEHHARRHSVVSHAAWTRLFNFYTTKFFKRCQDTDPITVDIVKALLFIKFQRPDILDVSFLKHHAAMVKSLATAFDMQSAKLDFTPIDIDQNLAVFSIPKARLDNEIKYFTKYLGEKSLDSAGLLAQIVIRELPNHDNGENVNIEISNPQVVSLFKEYLVAQKEKAEQMLVVHFNEKIEHIESIQAEVSQMKDLSVEEKKFLHVSCDKLKNGIKVKLASRHEHKSLEVFRQSLDGLIALHMAQMLQEPITMSMSNRCKSFINDICEVLGVAKPFTVNHGKAKDVVTNMKEILSDLKSSDKDNDITFRQPNEPQ